ncbi:hypothetical protein H8E88_25890 [candidate division KSB1 bacterium]|nr:hypothetical protein [candidate division KSB1 bacterium]
MKKNEKLQLLHERFLHLAQDILWDADAAKEVALNATEYVKANYQLDFPITEAQTIIAQEIEKFFQKLLDKISEGSKTFETKLIDVLIKKFNSSIRYRISHDIFFLTEEDAEEIVQNALITIIEKCKTAKPKSSFFLWAMKVLSYKYLEYRRKVKRTSLRELNIPDEERESKQTIKLGDIVSKRKREKQARSEDADELIPGNVDIDPFEFDPYDWSPTIFAENKNLKNCLLVLTKKMDERCKKVFEVLFSKGDVRFVHKLFPGLARERIDVIIFRCRQRLKNEAIKRSIL